ncbi:PEP-CTERM sorting domain-containing protein [Pseudoduganella sp. FT26W]|uniref:PEP-CTERM sorting domain-containing protein n=1 Tax=Duganella aquatilis TaxID=2666082 RepID=A0A844D0F8_9BURK|nr:FxDxF family PEP-CTERM protein [Duganella aquatilis]MRW86243.1 PEP-CTERM sorting domain-containing protein [Duganella aquatilis]
MKIKALVAGLMLAASFSASADVLYRPEVVAVTAPDYSFSNVKIGSITVTSLSDLTGSVFAATTVSFPFGAPFTLDTVTFTGASVQTLIGDLDASTGAFSYHNVAAGTYDVFASGVLGHNGQFTNAAFLGLNYSVTAVPEPETLGMLLGGLGLIGAVAARRKRAAS